jgi:two-component system sensor histidine kinase SenX3
VDATQVTFTVKDDGIGIAPEEQERIFEKFQRAADPEVQNETGTGIGLTTAREIVRRHGGDIELMSVKGEGSTFVVKIPIASASVVTAPAGVGV